MIVLKIDFKKMNIQINLDSFFIYFFLFFIIFPYSYFQDIALHNDVHHYHPRHNFLHYIFLNYCYHFQNYLLLHQRFYHLHLFILYLYKDTLKHQIIQFIKKELHL